MERRQDLVPWDWDNYYLGQNNSGKWRDQLHQLCLLQTQIHVLFLPELWLHLEKNKIKYINTVNEQGSSLACAWVPSTTWGRVSLGQCLLSDGSIDLVKSHHQKSRFFNKLLKAFIPQGETKENQMTRISSCRMFWLSELNRDLLCSGEAGGANFTFCSLVSAQSLLCPWADRSRALQVPQAHTHTHMLYFSQCPCMA